MKLISFRVDAFRSIVATGWLPFSKDGVTALVGQNESGKSAILDALHLAFGSAVAINPDDLRRGESLPSMALRLELSPAELSSICQELPGASAAAVQKALAGRRHELVFIANFSKAAPKIIRTFHLGPDLQEVVEQALTASIPEPAEGEPKTDVKTYVAEGSATFIKTLWRRLPLFALFREEDSYLPNTVDIDETEKDWLKGSQHVGADNFLVCAGLTLDQLLVEDDRERSSLLSTAVSKVNRNLTHYWRQVLGQRGKIKIEVEFARYPPSHATRPGAAYLRFWISEGEGEKLHPSQRSKGTRWYVAFFLHLTASQKEDQDIVLLLDEPGAYLHATAQEDVLRLVENLGGELPVLYSTHSPYLIDHKRIDRSLAVERDAQNEDSNTIVRRGLDLAASSHLTLAPVLAVMGTDLSSQQLIRRTGNILLEENSAYFYFSAFVLLTKSGTALSLVACNGADNVRLVADLLTAWRLEFKAAFDDDEKGKTVARKLRDKWQLAGDEYSKRILLLQGCAGIEDAFTGREFEELVAVGHTLGSGAANSKRVDSAKLSKPMLAHQFYIAVKDGRINSSQLSTQTLERFAGWLRWMEA
ncbi:ATP-dependent nuclease [Pseudoxanthomonas winnipegensis]|uniref:ATP-dependent nuclease n=1 Tax=Pseudoxanthomonas winnipegensis TaxID=2480810 RepID=UPI0013F16C57|nr:AAA family ATPase [Pseudoxanthomonas winnipegensis]